MDSSGEIMVLGQGGFPWKDHLLTLEEDLDVKPSLKFVLFEDQNGKWRVQCVPVDKNSFENRCVHRLDNTFSVKFQAKQIFTEQYSHLSTLI